MADICKSRPVASSRQRRVASTPSLPLLVLISFAFQGCSGDSADGQEGNSTKGGSRNGSTQAAPNGSTRSSFGAAAGSDRNSTAAEPSGVGGKGIGTGGASFDSSQAEMGAGSGGALVQTGPIASEAGSQNAPLLSGGASNTAGQSSRTGGTVNMPGTGGASTATGGTVNMPGTGGASTATGGTVNTVGIGGAGGEPGSAGGATAGSAGTSTTSLPLESKPCAGYTLLGMPETSNGTKFPARLIDMDGNVVHTWAIGGFPPKMLPGGSLIGCVGVVGTYDCGEMQQITWDGALEWSFSNWVSPAGTPVSRQHHDLQREGNPVGFYAPGQNFVPHGKTLVLAHIGRSVPTIREQYLLDDVIYEVDGAGALTNDFRWYGADHIDQFGFDSAARSQIRTTAPGNNLLEWLHGNSLSVLGPNRHFDAGHTEFSPENLLYSSRDSSFVAVISRATGDVVWRIGPDFAGRPEERLGQFAGQHHPHMIPRGLPGAGNILVFDNGGASGYGSTPPTGAPSRYARSYSRVLEFDPVTFEIIWQYGNGIGDENFFSQLISSAQRLPNKNTLITIGQSGKIIEVTPDKHIVWQYQQPATAAGATASLYRAVRIPPEWLPAGENALLGGYTTWKSLFEP